MLKNYQKPPNFNEKSRRIQQKFKHPPKIRNMKSHGSDFVVFLSI
jgi:hypothetical protein